MKTIFFRFIGLFFRHRDPRPQLDVVQRLRNAGGL